jgi:hypothetical protein
MSCQLGNVFVGQGVDVMLTGLLVLERSCTHVPQNMPKKGPKSCHDVTSNVILPRMVLDVWSGERKPRLNVSCGGW